MRADAIVAPRLSAVIAVAAIALAGCGGGGAPEPAAQPPSTVTVTVAETVTKTVVERPAPAPAPDPGAEPATMVSEEGVYSSVAYPASWRVESSEEDKEGYLDTTIRADIDPNVMIRIDVSVGVDADPSAQAAEVETYLVSQPGYRRLAFQAASLAGYDAWRWDFVVREKGLLLRKSDTFFTTGDGDTFAVLIQAPTSSWSRWSGQLERARASIGVTDYGTGIETEAGASDPYTREGEADFCATHDCIDNFDEGVGSIVQCADGEWSRSGGRPGACSWHGGVAGGSSSDSGYSYDSDTNGDGSAYNWCGASRDGDGDGLWCEGR